MKNTLRVIFHIDLNAFYASCHMIEEPYLKEVPFIVGGSAVMKRGIVLTASYKARQFGIKSGMSVKEAMDLCDHLRVIPPEFNLYQRHSKRFFEYIETKSSLILKASIDEAYMDMTHVDDPSAEAKIIQDTLLKEYFLPSSIGIASTLFLAKMASDLKKPLGITILRKKDIVSLLFNESIASLYGLGRKTYPILMNLGIQTIGDFTKENNKETILKVMKESQYQSFIQHIYGNSSNIIPKDSQLPKIVSQETTFNYALDDSDMIKEKLIPLIDYLLERFQAVGLHAKTIGIKLKTDTFKTQTKSYTLDAPTQDVVFIKDQMLSLYDRYYDNRPIRLIGAFIQLNQEDEIFNVFTYDRFLDY